jgi:hypothetical protein
MKKVDFFRDWAKQFEPGYKGPWLIDSLEPEELGFCGCCHIDEHTQLNRTLRILEVEIDLEFVNSTYSIYANSGVKVLTGVFSSLVNTIELGELPDGDYTLCLGEENRHIFMVFTIE